MKVLSVIILLAIVSCGIESDKKKASIDYALLVGYWNIESALRNGKSTSTLNDAYLQFSDINELSTNIFGEDTKQQLIWKDSIAMVSDSSMTYALNYISSDSISLSFSVQRNQFDLQFLRGASERTNSPKRSQD